MKIREMETRDYLEAMELWNGSAGVGVNQDDSEENIERYLARNPKTSFVAVEEGRVVGAIMAGHDGYRGFIHHTAVAPLYRGRGVGEALVRAALDALRKEKINKVVLVAFKTNQGGNRFWEKQGFTVRDDLYYRNLRINND